jgi:predicted nucleic-acid-binding protein
MLEVIWVLQSAYSVTREDIILAINNLLQMQVLEFVITFPKTLILNAKASFLHRA